MLIKPSRFDSIKKLVDLAKIMKHITKFRNPLAIWLQLCEKAKQTDLDANINRWNTARKGGNTIKTLHYLAKLDDKDKYLEICQRQYIDDLFKDDKDDMITIESRYLLDQSKKLNDDTTLCDQIKRFYNDDNMKCLTLKSPMDTGKTVMMKSIIAKYNPKRILWVSYRKTLTYDIFSNFQQFNVKSYLDHNFTANRLIIQLESLLNLDEEFNICTEVEEVPKYDLVVLDEVESLLGQYASELTFKGKTRINFLFMEQVIRA